MKIFGHPIHLILIHFPSGLFPMECVCYGLLYYTGKSSFADASYYAMVGAVASGWAAALFGALDLIQIPSTKSYVLKKALIHGSINTTVLMIYSVLAYSLFKKYPELPDASLSLLLVKVGLVVFMIVGNYLGGSLVLKDRIGTEN